MKIITLILTLLLPVIASAEELIYDQNWNPKYRIEDGRIYKRGDVVSELTCTYNLLGRR